MNQKPDLSKFISEAELCKRWKCHWVTVKARAQKGYLTCVVENRQRYYSIEDVINTENTKPIRPYIKTKKRKSLQFEKIVNTTESRKLSRPKMAKQQVEDTNLLLRLGLWFKRLFSF